jgi:hypothetical protein
MNDEFKSMLKDLMVYFKVLCQSSLGETVL